MNVKLEPKNMTLHQGATAISAVMPKIMHHVKSAERPPKLPSSSERQ